MTHSWTKFVVFFLLSFALLGIIPVVDLLLGGGLMDFGGQAARASEQTGVIWTSSLFDIGRLALVEPGLWLLVFGSSVPLVAAGLVIMFSREEDKLRNIIDKINPLGRGTRSLFEVVKGYGLVVLACGVGLAGTAAIRFGLYGEALTLPGFDQLLPLLPLAVIAALTDQGALLEEGGWRGFASPALENSMTPLMAAILVGLVWASWHLPRDITGGVLDGMGAGVYWSQYFPSFTLSIIATSIIAVWGMKLTSGSLWPAVLAHGFVNDAMGLSGSADVETALTIGYQLTKAIPFAFVALAIVLVNGRSLGQRRP
jgi:membrane protease YdiL (CAAX protease family)